MSCPLQAKFQSIDNMPRKQNARATFGSCVHYALEVYNKTGSVEVAVGTFVDVWAHPDKIGVAPDFWPKYMTFGGYRERGIELVTEYHEKVKWEAREVIAEEHRFLVPFGEHELEGTIDLLESRKNSKGKLLLRVVDYKTNARAPTRDTLAYNIQFTTYVYASLQPEFWEGNGDGFPGIPNGVLLHERFREVPRRGIWFHLMTNKELDAGARDDADFMRLYRVCSEIQKAVERDVYVPSISGDACQWCDYTEPCGLPVPPSKLEEADEESWV